MKTILIIDVQNDFCPGGVLAANGGDEVVPVINGLLPRFDLRVATQDWHPTDHLSFASQHEGRNVHEFINLNGIEQVLWPDHCVQGSVGAEFHPELDSRAFQAVFRKGMRRELDSYSAFLENDRRTPTGLDGYLKGLGVNELSIAGLATDYCVYYSVLDALKLGYKVTLIENACRGVDFPAGNVARTLADMSAKGVKLSKA